MLEVANAINGFALDPQVSPEEQLFTFTGGQLRELIRSAVVEVLQEVREEQDKLSQVVQDLQTENRALNNELENLSRWIDAELISLTRRVSTEEAHTRGGLMISRNTRKEIDDIWTSLTRHATILTSIKGAATITPKGAAQKLEKLDKLLLTRTDPVTFAEVGKTLELGSRDPKTGKNTRKQNMTHLRRVMERYPDRYNIRQLRRGKAVTLTSEYRAKLKHDRR